METVPMHTAKNTLPQLVKRAAEGEVILIGGDGAPKAALTSPTAIRRAKRIGILAGKLTVPDDFDAPLPDDLLSAFEGKA